MDALLPTFPPPAYHLSHSDIIHAPHTTPPHIARPSHLSHNTQSKWSRRSYDSSFSSPSPSLMQQNWQYTESNRNYRLYNRRKFILFMVAILLMVGGMLAIVGATTRFRLRSGGCTTTFVNGSWVCM